VNCVVVHLCIYVLTIPVMREFCFVWELYTLPTAIKTDDSHIRCDIVVETIKLNVHVESPFQVDIKL